MGITGQSGSRPENSLSEKTADSEYALLIICDDFGFWRGVGLYICV